MLEIFLMPKTIPQKEMVIQELYLSEQNLNCPVSFKLTKMAKLGNLSQYVEDFM